MGALFASCILEEDDMTLYETGGFFPRGYGESTSEISMSRNKMDDRLGRFFDIDQLRLIESAFEQSEFGNLDYDLVERAVEFGNRYKVHGTRLRAIMQNIIDNRGTFVP